MSEEGTSTAGESQTGATSAQAASGKTFSQDDLERIVQQRLGREREKFSDYDDLKAKAARADELEQANQSEADKLRTRAEREAQKRADAEDRAAKAQEKADSALKRAAVVSVAAQANAADPADVWTLLDKSSLSLEDDGTVKGVKDAVDQLLKAKPHLQKRAGGFDGGANGASSSSTPDMNALIRREAGFGPAR